MTFQPPPLGGIFGGPPEGKPTPAQSLLHHVQLLLSSLETRVVLEEQRRAMVAAWGRLQGMPGMPSGMTDQELQASRQGVEKFRQIIGFGPLLSELEPEQLELFVVLVLAGNDVKSAAAQAKDGIGIDGKLALIKAFEAPK